MKDTFKKLMSEVAVWMKSWIPAWLVPTTWKGWALLAGVGLLMLLWVFDRVPSQKQFSELPRPLLTSEVSDYATKQDVLVNMKQMVMAYEKLQARVEALESKSKVKR